MVVLWSGTVIWFLLLYLDMYKRNTEKSIIDAYLYVLVIVSARGLFI